MKEIKILDLFSGMGGMHLGFHQALKDLNLKGKTVAFSDIKKHSHEILKENYPKIPILKDIRNIEASQIEDFDFLLGGFPCQAFSTAGKRAGFEDTRGTLFFEIARILKEKKPFGFLLENVEGLLSHNKTDKKELYGETFKSIIDILEDLGYHTSWSLENSLDFNVPQERKRVYIVGTLKRKPNLEEIKKFPRIKNKNIIKEGLKIEESNFIKKLLQNYSLKELEGKSIKDKRGGKNNIHSWDFDLKGKTSTSQRKLMNLLLKERRKKHWAKKKEIPWMDGMPLTIEEIKTFIDYPTIEKDLDYLVDVGYLKLEYPKNILINEKGLKQRVQDTTKEIGYNIITGKLSFDISKILDPEGTTPTLLATDMDKIYIADHKSEGLRKISIEESLKQFGFPSSYKAINNEKKMYDLLGNTVVVPVIKEISKTILNIYKD